MPDAPDIVLCPKLCRRNPSNRTNMSAMTSHENALLHNFPYILVMFAYKPWLSIQSMVRLYQDGDRKEFKSLRYGAYFVSKFKHAILRFKHAIIRFKHAILRFKHSNIQSFDSNIPFAIQTCNCRIV